MARQVNGTPTGFCDKNGKDIKVGNYISGPLGVGCAAGVAVNFSGKRHKFLELVTIGKCLGDYSIVEKLKEPKVKSSVIYQPGDVVVNNAGLGVFTSYTADEKALNVVGFMLDNVTKISWVISVAGTRLASKFEVDYYNKKLAESGFKYVPSQMQILKVDDVFSDGDFITREDGIGIFKKNAANAGMIQTRVWTDNFMVVGEVTVKGNIKKASIADITTFYTRLQEHGFSYNAKTKSFNKIGGSEFTTDIESIINKLKNKGLTGKINLVLDVK